MPRGNAANLTQAGKGRPKGIPNKVSTTFRETVSNLLSDNAANVGVWLARVAENDPGKALDLMAKLAEYAAPKLSKVEQTSEVNVTHGYAFRIERASRPVLEGEIIRELLPVDQDTPAATPAGTPAGTPAAIVELQVLDK